MVAPCYARAGPEGLGDLPHAARRCEVGVIRGCGGPDGFPPRFRDGWCLPVRRLGHSARESRHDQCSLLTQTGLECLDDRDGAPANPADAAQGGVNEERSPLSDAKGGEVSFQRFYSRGCVGFCYGICFGQGRLSVNFEVSVNLLDRFEPDLDLDRGDGLLDRQLLHFAVIRLLARVG